MLSSLSTKRLVVLKKLLVSILFTSSLFFFDKTSMYHRPTVKYDIALLSDTIKIQRAITAKY